MTTLPTTEEIDGAVIAVKHALDIAVQLLAEAYAFYDCPPDPEDAEQAFYALYDAQKKARELNSMFFARAEQTKVGP